MFECIYLTGATATEQNELWFGGHCSKRTTKIMMNSFIYYFFCDVILNNKTFHLLLLCVHFQFSCTERIQFFLLHPCFPAFGNRKSTPTPEDGQQTGKTTKNENNLDISSLSVYAIREQRR